MRDFLLFVHPVPILVALGGFFLSRKRSTTLNWPGLGAWAVWSAFPAAFNSPLWLYGSKVFGWTFGGLGGWFYSYLLLPANGLVFGAISAPLLNTMLRHMSSSRKIVAGAAVQATVLFVNLGISSLFGFYTGNLGP